MHAKNVQLALVNERHTLANQGVRQLFTAPHPARIAVCAHGVLPLGEGTGSEGEVAATRSLGAASGAESRGVARRQKTKSWADGGGDFAAVLSALVTKATTRDTDKTRFGQGDLVARPEVGSGFTTMAGANSILAREIR